MPTKQKEALFSAVIAITTATEPAAQWEAQASFPVEPVFAQVLEFRISLKVLEFKHVSTVDYSSRALFKTIWNEIIEGDNL